MLVLRDTIKNRVGEIASNAGAPTIFKFNPEDEWHTSYDIKAIGNRELYGGVVKIYDEITTELPNFCFIKQVGTLVEEVHYISPPERTIFGSVIPNDIFKYAVNVVDFSCVFSDETGVKNIQSIPENLFANCHKVINFNGAFNYCRLIEEISVSLFANNKEALDFRYCFFNCESLKSVPKDLFKNNKKADKQKAFYGCFAGCDKLKPEDLPDFLID